MKIRLLILALFITTFTCCKKDTNSETQEFGYVLNTVAYAWDLPLGSNSKLGAQLLRYPVPNSLKDTIYLLQAWDMSKKISINFAIPIKTLTTGTFKAVVTSSSTSTSSNYISNNLQYAPIVFGDSTQVTITSIADNHVSGSFKGLMHDLLTQAVRLDIGNGHFNHLAVSQ